MVKLGSTSPVNSAPGSPKTTDKAEKKQGKSTFTISEPTTQKSNTDRKNKGKP